MQSAQTFTGSISLGNLK